MLILLNYALLQAPKDNIQADIIPVKRHLIKAVMIILQVLGGAY